MKTKFRNFLIFCISIFGIPYLRILLLKNKEPVVRVLCYHHIYNVEMFRREIVFLNKKFNIVSPEDFIEKKYKKNKINILLTFDDGYKSWHTHVLPLFKEFSLRGIFFVSSGFIMSGQEGEEEAITFAKKSLNLNFPKKPLSVAQLKEMEEVGVVGGHTHNHTKLSTIEYAEKRNEITTDKKQLEFWLGHKLIFFAAPYGTNKDYGGIEAEIVEQSGYSYGFSTEIDFYTKKHSPLIVPRVMIEHGEASILTLFLFVIGGYDLPYKLKNLISR